jgi:hypothetical protein
LTPRRGKQPAAADRAAARRSNRHIRHERRTTKSRSRRPTAGDKTARRFLEFFAATIRNKNTRMAYYRAAARFFAWCDHHKIGEIADIEPLHVAGYVEALGKDFEEPTVKQHFAAIRMLFDWLVTAQVVATNPAHAVRGPKHVVKTGKTTVLTGEQARELLDRIDTSTGVGLRDRALISVMTFAFARIGAAVEVPYYHHLADLQGLVDPLEAPADFASSQQRPRERRLGGEIRCSARSFRPHCTALAGSPSTSA